MSELILYSALRIGGSSAPNCSGLKETLSGILALVAFWRRWWKRVGGGWNGSGRVASGACPACSWHDDCLRRRIAAEPSCPPSGTTPADSNFAYWSVVGLQDG